ncbi:S-layer homology domain-containing protein [Paenibacillus ehimensis]|uniref:S-layer homology domain-containing protein n=1 Tax=Paenibacillus ehimensis TaxID=79264 RepID=A0ABT8VH45_9BACL|nr:S-layer homology domain-containing protein [Paenibacillus ehimensis]MDO3680301.1 S-layer homology domain-containing protein [Paenibacillus ehimensis]MEC0213258.1 S-layer homology domain-containing protein [Paenibacillus ehimensis]
MSQIEKKNVYNRERSKTQVKSTVLKKTSKALAALMIGSMLLPVLAFAAVNFDNVSYNKYNKTVTGSVYSDTYTVSDNVYFSVYSDSATQNVLLSSFNATNFKTVDGVTYYDFKINLTSVSDAVYDAVYVKTTDGVAEAVYRVLNSGVAPENPINSGSSGWGGGGGSISNDGVIEVFGDSVDAFTLQRAFENSKEVKLKIKGEKLAIPADVLAEALKKGAISVTIINDNGTITLPLAALKLEALAKELGAELKDTKINVTIAKVADATVEDVTKAVYAAGGTPIKNAVDFNVTASGNSKSVDVDFGSTYVSRTLNVNKNLDANKATGALYNETTKKLSFVPSTFESKDGQTVATLKRNGSSIYTVIEANKSFEDLASHWSKADVELLANKLVVEGVSDKQFQPDRNITRAEFAALVVRSLGLNSVTANTYFTDINASAWYADAVATASKAGIINGYEDSTFRPDAQITREELAAMIIRALTYAGVASEVSESNQAQLLAKFKDSSKIVWAKKEIAAAVNAGIINGLTDDTIGSAEKATRSQAATMLKRYLGLADFID